MDQALKFTWAYMIERGRLTTGKWSYYGGNFDDVTNDWQKSEKMNEWQKGMMSE